MTFIQPAIHEYLKSLNRKEDYQLDLLQKMGHADNIPIVDDDVGKFLYMITLLKNPENILEIGFGGGYSTLWMAKALKNGKITSLELNTDRLEIGKKAFNDFHLSSKVDIIYKDAIKYLEECEEAYFDIVFLDAIKRSYIKYLPLIKRALKKGGIFLTDNILFRGNPVKPDVDKKYQAGTQIIKDFNKILSESKDYETIFLPIGDGLSFSIRLK